MWRLARNGTCRLGAAGASAVTIRACRTSGSPARSRIWPLNCYNEVPFFWDTKPNAKPLYEVTTTTWSMWPNGSRRWLSASAKRGPARRRRRATPAKKATRPSRSPWHAVQEPDPRHVPRPDVRERQRRDRAVQQQVPAAVTDEPAGQHGRSTRCTRARPASRTRCPTPSPHPAEAGPEDHHPKGDSLPVQFKNNQKTFMVDCRHQHVPRFAGTWLVCGRRGVGVRPHPGPVGQEPGQPSVPCTPTSWGNRPTRTCWGPKTKKLTNVPVKKPRPLF